MQIYIILAGCTRTNIHFCHLNIRMGGVTWTKICMYQSLAHSHGLISISHTYSSGALHTATKLSQNMKLPSKRVSTSSLELCNSHTEEHWTESWYSASFVVSCTFQFPEKSRIQYRALFPIRIIIHTLLASVMNLSRTGAGSFPVENKPNGMAKFAHTTSIIKGMIMHTHTHTITFGCRVEPIEIEYKR